MKQLPDGAEKRKINCNLITFSLEINYDGGATEL